MNGINVGRVVLGGLLAGLIIDIGESVLNAGLLAADMTAALQRSNLPDVGGSAIAVFLVLGFALVLDVGGRLAPCAQGFEGRPDPLERR